MVDPNKLNIFAKLVSSLVEYQNVANNDIEKTTDNYMAKYAALKKKVQELNKLQKNRTRSTAKPCPSISAVKDDNEDTCATTTGRIKRKAALKAMEIPKRLTKKKTIKRNKKRKSSSSPERDTVSQAADTYESSLDSMNKRKMITDCSVVLRKIDIPLDFVPSTSKIEKMEVVVPVNSEESKPPASLIDDLPKEPEKSESPSDTLGSKLNPPTIKENGKNDTDEETSSESKIIQHTVITVNEDNKDNNDQEISPVKARTSSRITKTSNKPENKIIETSLIEVVKPSNDSKQLKNMTVEVSLQKSLQVKCNETKILHSTLKRQLPEESPSSSSKDDQPAPKLKIPKVFDEQPVVQAEPVVVRVTPKRITRSKMVNKDKAPAGDKKTPEVSDTDVVKASPEKRVTRSKMAKPKENKIVISCTESSSNEDDSPLSKKTPLPIIKIKSKVLELREIYTPSNAVQEKENCFSRGLKTAEKKNSKISPLQNRNAFVTPAPKTKVPNTILLTGTKQKPCFDELERRRKEEEAIKKRLKEEEAIRKRNELLKAKQDDIRRRNEEKMMKVAAIREANNKETNERLVKMEKEKEERERITKELIEKKKEEGTTKKRIMHETKALEAEARRYKEEAARLARIRELEEEKRKEEELRIKQQEDMEKLRKQRIEEQRMKEAAYLKAKELQKKKAVIPLKDKDNYDINDIEPNDSEDDDENVRNPKKEIPLWAKKGEDRSKQEAIQSFVPMDLVAKYFCCPSQSPDLKEFFGKMTMKRVRTSSAVWLDTPPLKTKS